MYVYKQSFLKFVQTPYVPAGDGNNWLVHSTQQD